MWALLWQARRGNRVSGSLSVSLPPELVDEIVDRVVELVDHRLDGDEVVTDGWLRGAQAIADYIDAPRSRVYALANCNPSRIPVERDGSNLLAKRSDLDRWVASGGGKRP
jgi:hypothetical protein